MNNFRKIRKPAWVSRRIMGLHEGVSLAHQMRLADTGPNLNMFFDCMNTIGTLCDRHFPFDEKLPEDKESKQANVIAEIKRRHPFMEQYVDDWPIPIVLAYHRQLRRGGSPKGIIRNPSEIAVAKRQVLRCGSYVGNRRNPTAARARRNNNSALGNDVGSRPASVTIESSSRVSTVTHSTLPPERPSSAVVHDFLRGLAQDLSALLPVFISHGVKDEPSLKGVLHTNNWRGWLYSWVKEGQLNELQFQMISEGLAEIGRTWS